MKIPSIDSLYATLYPQTEPIVIALAYPVGADAEEVELVLRNQFQEKGFEVHFIRISQLIASERPSKKSSSNVRDLQASGTYLCEKHKSSHYLGLRAMEEIRRLRKSQTRQLFIVRSLKRVEEVQLLRAVYGSSFYLLGLNTPLYKRIDALKLTQSSTVDIDSIIKIDESEDTEYGQNLSDTYELADYFIDTYYGKEYPLGVQVQRFVRMLFGNLFITPTPAENAMFLAYASSYVSSDMGRQVGACITNNRHQVLALGSNEVPAYGGGTFWPKRSLGVPNPEEDPRDWSIGVDPNDREKEKIAKELGEDVLAILRTINESDMVTGDLFQPYMPEELEGLIAQYLGKRVSHLTEFGRTVHAEMAAILNCATNGISTKSTKLYCTTFPCHNCARHIVAAGIEKVVYIEPYPKSKARDLHSDSIVYTHMSKEPLTALVNAVRVVPFFGMGPRKYIDHFATRIQTGVRIERKKGGMAISVADEVLRDLRTPLTPHNYISREELALKPLTPRPSKKRKA